MKKTFKLLAAAALFTITAGALTGCLVETQRPWHRPYHRVVVYRAY